MFSAFDGQNFSDFQLPLQYFLIINLHLLSHGIGVFSCVAGELDLDRRLGTLMRSPSAGLDARIEKR